MKLGVTALFTLLLAISSASGFSVESKRTRATNSALFRSQTFHSEQSNYFQRNKSQTALDHLHMTGGDGGLKSYPTLAQEMIAEFIGTFIIVQIGCGTVCAAIYEAAQVGLWQIAAVWASIPGRPTRVAHAMATPVAGIFSWLLDAALKIDTYPFLL